MENSTNICVDPVITKALVQRVIITVTVIANEKATTHVRITVIAQNVSVIAMDLARNASVTGKIHEVVLTIVSAKMTVIGMEKDTVTVTVKDRVTMKDRVIVRDHVILKGRATVRDHATVVESVTKSAGVTETAKAPAVRRDMAIEIKEERVTRQAIREKMHIMDMNKRRARLASLKLCVSLQCDSFYRDLQ